MCGRHAEAQALRRREARSGYPVIILAGHVGDVQAAAADASRWTQWGAGMWAGLTFLEDCRNTCPAYFRGLHWHNLLKTLTTLCNALENVDPQIAEIGTRVYEQAA